jgi:hypothetical protein
MLLGNDVGALCEEHVEKVVRQCSKAPTARKDAHETVLRGHGK